MWSGKKVHKVTKAYNAYKVAKCYFLTLSALCALSALPAFSAQLKSGAEFLNIPVGARAVGLGQAYTSMANGVSALHWNPAGLGRLNQNEFSAMHTQWLFNTQYNFIGFGHPTSVGTIAGSMVILSQDETEARDANRNKTGSIEARDSAVSLGFGKQIGRIHAGAGIKMLQSQIAQFKAQTTALDLGVMYAHSKSLSFGLSAQNLGPGMKFINQRDPLPLNIALGGNLILPHGLVMAMDVSRHVHNHKTDVRVGTEYQLMPTVSLRGGYLANGLQFGNTAGTGLNGISAGVGFKIMGYSIDYAMTPFGALGDAHRLSLNFRF